MTKTAIGSPDDENLADFGRTAIAHRRLEPLREYLGLSRNAMAELLHTSPITYTKWEVDPGTRIWPSTAQRVGAFYKAAHIEIAMYENEHGKGSLQKLVPFHVAATYAGIPNELLLHWHRDGVFTAVDLGVLGLWVDKAEIQNKLSRTMPDVTANASIPLWRRYPCPECKATPYSLCRDPRTRAVMPNAHEARKEMAAA